jgi:hypothetical protein
MEQRIRLSFVKTSELQGGFEPPKPPRPWYAIVVRICNLSSGCFISV